MLKLVQLGTDGVNLGSGRIALVAGVRIFSKVDIMQLQIHQFQVSGELDGTSNVAVGNGDYLCSNNCRYCFIWSKVLEVGDFIFARYKLYRQTVKSF